LGRVLLLGCWRARFSCTGRIRRLPDKSTTPVSLHSLAQKSHLPAWKPPYTFGDAPRDFGSGPGTSQVDASLLKDFPFAGADASPVPGGSA
jgi:hypothetical protein